MSDLCMYQFEDIVWDEYYQSDDHIVPHPGDKQAKEISFQGDSCKKPRCEVTGISRSCGDKSTATHVGQERPQGELSTSINKRNNMLEKDSWCRKPQGPFLSPYVNDTAQEDSSLASEDNRISSHDFNSNNNIESNDSEVCANDPTLDDKCTAVGSNSLSYPLGDLSQTDDLSFLDKNPEERDPSDLLHYDWPDIGNFEDVDRMFRSCDSTFGLGMGRDDELGWFSSDDTIGGSGDILKSDFFCPEPKAIEKISEIHAPTSVNASYSTNDTTRTTATIRYQDASWSSERDESASRMSSVNDKKKEVMPIEQERGQNGKIQPKVLTNNHCETSSNGAVNEHKKQPKQQNQSQRKRKEQCSGNNCFNFVGNLPTEVRNFPSGATSDEAFQSMAFRPQQKALVPDSCDYLQNAFPYVHSDSNHLSDKTSAHTTPSAIRSDNDELAFLSPGEPSSYASSQVQFMENSGDPSFQVAAIGSEKREKQDNHQGSPSSILNPFSVEKKVHRSRDKFRNHSDVNGVNMAIPGELCSSNIKESSSLNSAMDDISIEAASFQQLQLVMEQLDMKTKLCIRDSLYRLARNAEQRHNQANPNLNGGCKDERDSSGGFTAEASKKCTGFMDMETDTNPVDRSIAHLLFHRPSDSSTPVNNSFSFRSPSMAHGSISSMPVMDEKSINKEAAAAETKKIVS